MIDKFDKCHLWHPYTSMNNPIEAQVVKSAKGSIITLKGGKKLVDGMSSWWCALHGYNHALINKAIKKQSKKLSHIMFGGLTHKPAIKLGKKLLQIVPKNLTKIFYSDSGSVSVEVALKMSVQYQKSLGFNQKINIMTPLGGYHGDTWNAMSVSDPKNGMHSLFEEDLPKRIFIPKPLSSFEVWDKQDEQNLRESFANFGNSAGAFIVEPIVQGAGGMRFYHPNYLKILRELCDEFGVLLILDEIATGFGRTGKMFACEYADIAPDIMCIGKALSGGTLSFAATLCSDEVARAVSDGEAGVFMHGPTFMANPLSCAVSLASLKLLLKGDWEQNIKRIESRFKLELTPLKTLMHVEDVRVLGAIGVVELKCAVDMQKITKEFLGEGIWVRPFGKLVYLMPPFNIKEDELKFLCKKFVKVVSREI